MIGLMVGNVGLSTGTTRSFVEGQKTFWCQKLQGTFPCFTCVLVCLAMHFVFRLGIMWTDSFGRLYKKIPFSVWPAVANEHYLVIPWRVLRRHKDQNRRKLML